MYGDRDVVSDRAVRSGLVVISTLILQLFAGIGKRHEPVGIQAFGSELAVERFDEPIVRRLAWTREVQCYAVRIGPEIHISGDELTAIVDPDRLRTPDLSAHVFKRPDDILAAVGEARIGCGAEARMGVDHGQGTELPTGSQLIMNEVQRPDLVRSSRPLTIFTQLRLHTALGMLVSQLQP